MQENQSQEYFRSVDRRKRTMRIVIAHLLIVATFFTVTFIWGSFE